MERPENVKVGDKFLVVNEEYSDEYKNGDIVTVRETDAWGDGRGFRILNNKSVYWREVVPVNDINHLYEGMILLASNLWGEGKVECMVLGVCGNAVFVSESEDFDSANDIIYTKQELARFFTVKGAESNQSVVELTMDQIAEKFGLDIKDIRVKKE